MRTKTKVMKIERATGIGVRDASPTSTFAVTSKGDQVTWFDLRSVSGRRSHHQHQNTH